MIYTTKGGTTFESVDDQVTIMSPDGSTVTIPEDDLEEFTEQYFTAESLPKLLPVPEGFEVISANPVVTWHHPDVCPLLLKTEQNVYSPFIVWCPKCGVHVMSSTEQDAIDLWNSKVKEGQTASG